MERSISDLQFRFSDAGIWPRSPLGDWAMRGAGSMIAGVLRGVEVVQDVALEMGLDVAQNLNMHDHEAIAKWLVGRGWPARPLQIGILDPEGWGASIMEAPGVLTIDWVALNEVEVERGDLPEALDAVVACFPDGRLCVRVFEHEGKSAAWFDWAYERPRSYPGTFPMRVDCSQLTIESRVPGLSPDSRLSRLLIEAASLLARHPARVQVKDSLAGRLPTGAQADVTGVMYPQHRQHEAADPLAPVVRQLVELMGPWELSELRSPAGKIAARLMSAWAASAASDRVEPTLRRIAADMAGSVIDDEVEVLLRVGAVRMADGDAVAGLYALECAATILAGTTLQNPPDQVLFLLSELGGVRHDPYAIGRIAGGLVLLGATTPCERFPHLRDDILDEMQHSGALIDLEQDQLVILRTLAMLERVLGVVPRAQQIVDKHAEDEVESSGPGLTWSMMPHISRDEQPKSRMPVRVEEPEAWTPDLPPIAKIEPAAMSHGSAKRVVRSKSRAKATKAVRKASASKKKAAKQPKRRVREAEKRKNVVGKIEKPDAAKSNRRGRKAA
jgi:hypothetical protein